MGAGFEFIQQRVDAGTDSSQQSIHFKCSSPNTNKSLIDS
jgi:hypothetical protein